MSRELTWFVVRRLLVLVVLLVVVSFGIFSLVYLAPGDPLTAYLGTQPRTPETVRTLRQEFHLDRSFLEQYWLWLRGAVQLDLGTSIATRLSVDDEIRAALPISLFLGVYAYLLSMAFGIGLGILAALRRAQAVDRAIVWTGIVALSTPAFVSGVLLLYLFAVVLHVFPAFGPGTGFADQLWHLTLPALALAFVGSAYVLRHTRVAMVGVLDQDYVTFARARGLSPMRVLFTYALRNALIPVVTISGVILALVITGAVLVEVTFSLPGIGRLLVTSATAKDIPTIQGIALVVAVVIMLANLLADLAYVAVDPRIRLTGGRA